MKVIRFFIIAFTCFCLQITAQDSIFPINFIVGKQSNTNLTSQYNLIPAVEDAFNKMQRDALKEGISIQIVSAYRSFKRQQSIFLKKYKKYKQKGLSEKQTLTKITEYSTIPGTSRHHWGTDIDIVQQLTKMPRNLLVENNYSSEGSFCPMKQWMDQNAYKYGFYLVYTENKNRTGFKYEPWHYSYAPISKKILQKFIIENNKGNILPIIKQAGINIEIPFYSNYIQTHVKGINPLLLEF